MKNPFSFRWFIRPEGLLVLLAAFWIWLYLMIAHWGYDTSIFYALQIEWPESTAYWPLAPLVFAGVYHLTRRFRQWKVLQYFHTASLMFIPVLLYLWGPLMTNIQYEFHSFPNAAMQQEWERGTKNYVAFVEWLTWPAGIFIYAGQLAFAVNLIAGFIRGKKPSA